jgi:hypothetical protein
VIGFWIFDFGFWIDERPDQALIEKSFSAAESAGKEKFT